MGKWMPNPSAEGRSSMLLWLLAPILLSLLMLFLILLTWLTIWRELRSSGAVRGADLEALSVHTVWIENMLSLRNAAQGIAQWWYWRK